MLLRHKKIPKLKGAGLTLCKGYDRLAEWVIHNAVQRIAQRIVAFFAVAFLADGVLPYLAYDNAVGRNLLCGAAYETQNLVG